MAKFTGTEDTFRDKRTQNQKVLPLPGFCNGGITWPLSTTFISIQPMPGANRPKNPPKNNQWLNDCGTVEPVYTQHKTVTPPISHQVGQHQQHKHLWALSGLTLTVSVQTAPKLLSCLFCFTHKTTHKHHTWLLVRGGTIVACYLKRTHKKRKQMETTSLFFKGASWRQRQVK